MSRTTVTFNGHELTQDYYVSNLRTSLLPRTVGLQEVPGFNGMLYTGAKLTERSIVLTLTAVSKNIVARQAAARNLAALLAVDEPKPLQISIDGGLYYMAIPQSSDDAVRWVNATSFDVVFECPDPIAYGTEQIVTVPSGGSVTFDVGGTYPAMPVVSASAAQNGQDGFWRLALDDGSYLLATIPAGVTSSPVVADCGERTLMVNGSVSLLAPEADWLSLAPGAHTLTMTGAGAATVTYNERWL